MFSSVNAINQIDFMGTLLVMIISLIIYISLHLLVCFIRYLWRMENKSRTGQVTNQNTLNRKSFSNKNIYHNAKRCTSSGKD